MRDRIFTIMFFLLFCLSIGFASGEMLATITEDVETEFATYHPIIVNIVPKARQFTVAPDFSNVSNFSWFSFTEAQKAKLLQNGFVAVHSGLLEMYDVYKNCELNHVPVFVTVDAMLHVFHEQFDYILKTLEKDLFISDIENLTDAMLAASIVDYNGAVDVDLKEAARCNVAYFAIAKELLDSTYSPPSYVQTLVDSEVALVTAHDGRYSSPLFIGLHDYSQFIVRGHYEGDTDLERYFRAMMWYGYMRFVISAVDVDEAQERRMILQGLIVTRLVEKLTISTEDAYDVWKRVYLPTVFFVGETDDPNVDAYDEVAISVYGSDYKNVTPDQLGETIPLDEYVAQVKALPPPLIAQELGSSFRLMGQRFIPDSWITEKVSHGDPPKLPSGLDVMAVLYSERAYELANDSNETIAYLRNVFAAYDESVWAQNLYWNWLYCFMPLLDIKGTGYPPFMQTVAWQDKDLAAALGSWTELRHDTILYAKQSYYTGEEWPDLMDQGYVEPNPEAFARLAALCQYAVDGLEGLGLIRSEFSDQLTMLKETLLVLKTVAVKELTNVPVTAEEYLHIRSIGSKMAQMTQFEDSPGGLQPVDSGEEKDDMAIIADVHTHIDLCLEEAVGRPLDLYVIVDVAGDLRVTRGAAFSYYEFVQPISLRLTDSQWKDMLDSGTAPDMPFWMNSYFDNETAASTSPQHSGEEQVEPAGMNVVLSPETVEPGQPIAIRAKDIAVSCTSVRVYVTRPNGTTFLFILTEDTEHPMEYIGSIDTTGWQDGFCYMDVKTYSGEDFTFSFHTFAVVSSSTTRVRSVPWTLYR